MTDPQPEAPALPEAIMLHELAEAFDHEIDGCYVGGREFAVNVFAYVRERRAPDLITEWATEPAGTPETTLEAPAPDDSGRALATADALAREHAGASWRERAEHAEAKLAETRQVAVNFRSHYAGVLHPNAEALYHAVLQVIDREPLERGDEKEIQ